MKIDLKEIVVFTILILTVFAVIIVVNM